MGICTSRGEVLFDLSDAGNAEGVSMLLERAEKKGNDLAPIVNWQLPGKTHHAYTSLMRSAWNGNKEIVEALIKHGANVDMVNDHDRSALMFAAMDGYTEIVGCLLAANAKVDLQDTDGMTALLYAAASEDLHTDIVRLLVDAGAAVDLAATNKHHKIEGQTALMGACKFGHMSAVDILLDSGADLHKEDARGHSALFYAAQYGHEDIVKHLIAKGADANKTNSHGHTAHHFAPEHVKEVLPAPPSDVVTTSEGKEVELGSDTWIDKNPEEDTGSVWTEKLPESPVPVKSGQTKEEPSSPLPPMPPGTLVEEFQKDMRV